MSQIAFFDSNIYINTLRVLEYPEKLSPFLKDKGLYFMVSKIVLMELWAGCHSSIEEEALTNLQENSPLMSFDSDHFIQAGKVMNQMRKEYNLEPNKRRQITWDLLIALTAQENKALLITENKEVFQTIQKFVDFEFATP